MHIIHTLRIIVTITFIFYTTVIIIHYFISLYNKTKPALHLCYFRLSLNNASQEAILRVRNERDYNEKRYDRAIDLFLSEYPNGEVRNQARRLDGYRPHKRKSKKKARIEVVPLSDSNSNSDSDDSDDDSIVGLSDISSDESEWTESESED